MPRFPLCLVVAFVVVAEWVPDRLWVFPVTIGSLSPQYLFLGILELGRALTSFFSSLLSFLRWVHDFIFLRLSFLISGS